MGAYVVNNDGSNDTRVDFVVTVPRWTDVSAATINGDVVIALEHDANADVTVSTVNGTFASEFSPSGTPRLRRGTTRTRIGKGGRQISVSTVNGRMHLARL